MGSCSSVHRNSFCSKTAENLVIPPSPMKDKPKNPNFLVEDVAFKSHLSPSRSTPTTTFSEPRPASFINGSRGFLWTSDHMSPSKEEAFFDSKAWLDSDCEDDFYSVNGDFTPSRGTTPVHHTFGTPKAPSPVTGPVAFSTEKKKKLLELFRESVRELQNDDVNNEQKEVKPIIHDILDIKSAQSTPYISGGNSTCSSETTMDGDHHASSSSTREKSVKPFQCCIPTLASCRSFSERRRKASLAIAAANGKA